MSLDDVLAGRRQWWVEQGDCLDVLACMPDESIDAIVTDPPYGIGFMGREWDTFRPETVAKQTARKRRKLTVPPPGHGHHESGGYVEYDRSLSGNQRFQVWCEAWGQECLRLLRPGGHLVSFGGTRTYHRLASGLEDAGFEVRDSLHWIFGSGFPKALDVSKAIDKMAGAERAVIGEGAFAARRPRADHASQGLTFADDAYVRPAGDAITAPATDDGRRWEGWGTALKPAHEPIVLVRKPLVGSVAVNVLTHGTGALNIDGCRVGMSDTDRQEIERMSGFGRAGYERRRTEGTFMQGTPMATAAVVHDEGRWPPNVLLSEEAAEEMDAQSGELANGHRHLNRRGATSGTTIGFKADMDGLHEGMVGYDDAGGASRFFPIFRYEAKADRGERDFGLEGQPLRAGGFVSNTSGAHLTRRDGGAPGPVKNHHPTVKPVALMVWLCRLVTPPAGVILDPFAGSGTTGVAALRCGFRFAGVERESEYARLARARITGDCPLFNTQPDPSTEPKDLSAHWLALAEEDAAGRRKEKR